MKLMPHSHNTNSDANLKKSFFINTGFVALEFIAGIMANSLALISDAAHNLTDSMSIGFSYYASRFAKRSATDSHTYGFGRAAILAATINATVLVVTAGLIYYEAYTRLFHPEPVRGYLVAGIALVGILSNGLVAYFASKSRKDLNARVVFLGNLVDIFSSVMAFVAGLLIIFTKQTWIDPAVSFVIATMLLIAAWQILKEASIVLMEGVPKGISVESVQKAIQVLLKVEKVDDLHIWSIRSDYNALSCHIVIDEKELKNSRKIVEHVKAKLREKYNIQHATIEVELEDCTKHEEHEKH